MRVLDVSDRHDVGEESRMDVSDGRLGGANKRTSEVSSRWPAALAHIQDR